jgi:hypothetical protein
MPLVSILNAADHEDEKAKEPSFSLQGGFQFASETVAALCTERLYDTGRTELEGSLFLDRGEEGKDHYHMTFNTEQKLRTSEDSNPQVTEIRINPEDAKPETDLKIPLNVESCSSDALSLYLEDPPLTGTMVKAKTWTDNNDQSPMHA